MLSTGALDGFQILRIITSRKGSLPESVSRGGVVRLCSLYDDALNRMEMNSASSDGEDAVQEYTISSKLLADKGTTSVLGSVEYLRSADEPPQTCSPIKEIST